MTSPGHLVAARYRLREQIGGGGMGAVWLARDELLGRDVAVKQVLPPAGADAAAARQQKERALREGRIAARLSHPHAISVYDVALEDGQPWLVMEYLPSRSLAAVLSEEGVLRVDQVAQIGAQVADALAATHAAGIVHRDVKPANVLIGRGGRVEGLVKITDFGISHASGDVTLTQTGQITGTPAFLAPEVAQGFEPGPASDVFSLGATLYTCLEGQPPFGMGDNALQQLHRVAGGIITPPRHCGALTEPLLRLLATDPADRPAMQEVRDELAGLAAGRDGDTTTVLTARTDITSPGRARTSRFGAVGAAGAAGAAAAGPGAAAPPPPTPAPPPPRPPSRVPDSEPARPAPAAPPAAVEPADRRGTAPAGADGRRRRRALWWVAAAAVAVIAGMLGFWAAAPDGGGTAAQQTPPTSAPATTPDEPTQGSPETPQEPSAPTSAPDTSEPSPSEPAGDPFRAEAVEGFLDDYHALVVDDPGAAYARTGPTLQGLIGPEGYADYWAQFADVELADVDARDGAPVVTGELVFRYPDGTSQRELHRFTMTTGPDGELLLDRDDSVRVLEGRG
ncbi:protein kinase [Geodermatophilus sp. YIM 151500]|uniref:serine/threonine-protein kinase n=1 Tax=Geodermatophilus sp. YIM 151500 TaxID=2984531 RepID=UPI0021E38291|nr:serine/threonine-protein kinase [Geodermatophilus sp. YIM 151500]MCV2491085.1 protein kinase [Geodermatophilus sp. YIM 151500]